MNSADLILRIILRISARTAISMEDALSSPVQIYKAQTINDEYLSIAHVWT